MILCSGCFDGLHAGHVAYLEAADRFRLPEERLMVAVAPDSYIRTQKGREPFWPQLERGFAVEAIEYVDAVVLHEAPSVAEVIRLYRPRVFVKGIDWLDRLPPDVLEACRQAKTAREYVHTPGKHTSQALV
jgi:cytidyltransferase-like protein